MSHVSDIILAVPVDDDDDTIARGVAAVSGYLEERYETRLINATQGFRRNDAGRSRIHLAAVNNLDVDGFVSFVRGVHWGNGAEDV